MLSYLKKYLEQVIISGLVALLLFASVVSWGRLIRDDASIQKQEIAVTQPTTNSSSGIKKKAVIFASFLIVVAEYLQLGDD